MKLFIHLSFDWENMDGSEVGWVHKFHLVMLRIFSLSYSLSLRIKKLWAAQYGWWMENIDNLSSSSTYPSILSRLAWLKSLFTTNSARATHEIRHNESLRNSYKKYLNFCVLLNSVANFTTFNVFRKCIVKTFFARNNTIVQFMWWY